MEAPSPSRTSSSGASASSQPPTTTASAVLQALAAGSPTDRPSTGVSKEIEALLETQKRVRAQRAQIAKDLKNAQRRRQRLKHKARLLTAADLASVLVLRQEEETSKASTPKRRRSSQPGGAAAQDVGNAERTPETADSDANEEGGDDAPELAAGLGNESREEATGPPNESREEAVNAAD